MSGPWRCGGLAAGIRRHNAMLKYALCREICSAQPRILVRLRIHPAWDVRNLAGAANPPGDITGRSIDRESVGVSRDWAFHLEAEATLVLLVKLFLILLVPTCLKFLQVRLHALAFRNIYLAVIVGKAQHSNAVLVGWNYQCTTTGYLPDPYVQFRAICYGTSGFAIYKLDLDGLCMESRRA